VKEETKESREASMDLVAGHWCSSIGHIPSLRSVIDKFTLMNWGHDPLK
jgi:hypothetical protein